MIRKQKNIEWQILEFIEWLALEHKVETRTKAESDYYADQFRIASNKASELLKKVRS